MEDEMAAQEYRDNKLRELILYIAMESEGDEAFGATKLNKLLFYADFIAYVELGDSITGEEYQALQWGPAPRRLVPVREKMLEEEEIAIRLRDFHGRPQERILALTNADVSRFTSHEIALVSHLILEWWGRTATEMSRQSHRFAGWQLARLGETIPYEVALVGGREPTVEEIRRGKELEELAQELLVEYG